LTLLRIQELRRQKGLSQFELGLRFTPPLHPRTVSRWERGVSFPSLANLQQLAHVLDVGMSQLFVPLEQRKPTTAEEVDSRGSP